MGFPLGGQSFDNHDLAPLILLDATHDSFIFVPPAADTVYGRGLILALNIAGDKLVPYVAAQAGTDSTGEPTAVLGNPVTVGAGPPDVQLTAIVSARRIDEGQLHTQLAPTAAITLQDAKRLRQTGIVPQAVHTNTILDNQS